MAPVTHFEYISLPRYVKLIKNQELFPNLIEREYSGSKSGLSSSL